MEIINHPQKSQEWLDVRARCFTASEAPAAMGASKYTTRTELLRQKATGMAKEIDASTQCRFDAGNQAEEAARCIVEDIIGDDLSPLTGTLEVDGLPLLASFDGITQGRDIVWETKLLNATLADAVRAGDLAPHYYWQLEQQLLVSGAERVYFTTSDGTPENTVGMWYEAVPGRREALIAGWKQFAEDLANYEHVEQTVAPAGRAPDSLPALLIEVTGMVTASNLAEFKAHALTVFEGIKTALVTDADFADAEKTVKWCKEVEDRLDAAKSHALAQTASIDELFRVIDQIKEESRSKRLALDKLVKAEKVNRKSEIITKAQIEITDHVRKLNERIGGQWMPVADFAPFAAAIAGLKSLDSMRDKVATALANEKIKANDVADRIQANRFEMEGELDWSFLVPDFASVCTKARDDFNAMLMSRIAKHNEAQAAKDKAAKEAEDARIAAAVEAERKAGEVRAAAAVESERVAEAARTAAVEAERIKNEAAAKAGEPQNFAAAILKEGTENPLGGLAEAAQPTPPLAPEEKRAVLVEAGDDVRAYLNTLGLNDKEFGRMRAVIMGFIQFQAARGLKVAA